MAIANSYFNSSPITDSDIFVGTKYTTNRTVNYTAQSIADYLNINSRISISGQLTFKFTILPNVAKTIAFENGGGDGRLFSSIDKLIVSILDAGGSNITVFLDYLIDSEILLAEQNQPNSFGHYKITSYTVTINPNFYELNLEYIGGNGNIYKDVYYDMTPWASSGGIGTTPNLQQVTDIGNTTTKSIIIDNDNMFTAKSFIVNNTTSGGYTQLSSDFMLIVSPSGTTSAFANGALTLGDLNQDITNPVNLSLINDTISYGVGLLLNSSASLQDISLIYHPDYFIPQAPGNSPSIFYIPYKLEGTYTLATLDDIPSSPDLPQVLNVGDRIFKGPFNAYTIEAEDIYSYVAMQEPTPLAGSTITIDNDIFNKENGVCLFSVFQGDGVIQFSGVGTIANNGVEGLITLAYSQGDVISIKYVGTETYYVDIVNKSSGGVPTLDQVLNEGYTGIDKSILLDTSTNIGYASLNYNQLVVADADYGSSLGKQALVFNSNLTTNSAVYGVGSIGFLTSGSTATSVSFENPTGINSIIIPDKSGTLATLDDIPTAGVTSVGLTMPSAFTVTNSPITSSGDIAVTGAGAVSQYVRGDGSLANFPTSSGGGSSLSFYFNGSVSQGTFGGVAFKEMDRTPILGAGTDFTINANGYIQSFITDAGVPNQLEIPAGNWNFETYFSASSGGGSPSFYVELYKWDGTTLTLIASNSANPEGITNGTVTDLYVSALAVPQTTLLATDRLAVRIYVTHSGRTITLHTEDNHLCQVITTFSTGLTALNGLTAQVQNLAVGTTGTDFAINSTTATHTFNLPTASAINRGALSSTDWTTFNNKQNNLKTFNRTQGVYYFEEFMGNQAGGLGASYSTVVTLASGNGTARTVATTNRTNQQGIIQHQTGTGATNFAGYAYGGLGTNGTLYIGSGSISLETYVTVETLSNATERFHTIFGYYNGSNFSNTANGIFFSYDEAGTMFFEFGAAATPNWKCYTRGASVTTRTNTSIPVVAGQWYKLRIDVNAAGNSVTFYIDETLVATHTTNIPATTTALLIISLINKTVGTTARSLLTDYFMYEEIFTNPR